MIGAFIPVHKLTVSPSAKHLRKRDREINSAHYPRIFFPEVYILEGGYSAFYQCHSERCDPKGYTPMDDPRHISRRDSDLHDFRKFNRTRSFTYGETHSSTASSSSSSTVNGVSSFRGGLAPINPLAFAAASAAQGRRSGATLSIAEEHEHEHDSSPLGQMMLGPGATNRFSSGDAEASPCQRVSTGAAPIFGSAKTRALGRAGFHRVASYAGTGAASSIGPAPRPRAF